MRFVQVEPSVVRGLLNNLQGELRDGLVPARRKLLRNFMDKVCVGKDVVRLHLKFDLTRFMADAPNGIRTRVATLKGWCPSPLDDGA